MVDVDVAERVAMQEEEAHEHALEGVYGARKRREAKVLGLRGVAEVVTERRDGWHVRDLCTGEKYVRPFLGRQKKRNRFAFADLPIDGGGFVVVQTRIEKDGFIMVPEEGLFEDRVAVQKRVDHLNDGLGLSRQDVEAIQFNKLGRDWANDSRRYPH